ncbi:MAG: iron-containing alcohol dehydrogenase [Haloarculaceae archaeon]
MDWIDDRLADRDDGDGTGLRIAPGCYAAEAGIAGRLDRYLGPTGELSEVAVLAGETALSAARDGIERSLDALGAEYTVLPFDGACSPDRIADHRRTVDAEAPDLLIGLGGGKALDAAKLVAEGRCPVATVPTVAATCAAWTPLSILHEEDGSYLGPATLSGCPEWVLVDTGIIANAPRRLLAAGIMDATAKHFETALIPPGRAGLPARLGMGVARESYVACLRDDARAALDACERNEPTDAMEDVIEACIAGPGLAAGLLGRQPHLLLAHVLCYRLLDHEDVRAESYHGERVAYGVLVLQSLLEGRETVAELKAWYEDLGTDLSLEALGLSDDGERTVASLAGEIHRRADYDPIEGAFSREDVRDAIATVEAL